MSLSLQNIPSVKEESWRYSNLRKALPEGLVQSMSNGAQDIEIVQDNVGEQGEAQTLVFEGLDGHFEAQRMKITLEEGATLILIEHHGGAGCYWRNLEVDITLAKGSNFKHCRIFEGRAQQGVSTVLTRVKQAQNSMYQAFSLLEGAGFVRNETHVEMQGAQAQCALNTLNLLDEGGHGDTTILVDHQAPHCRSDQFIRSLLKGKSRGVFQGKIRVARAAQKTEATQMSNAILLSDVCEMDVKPELEIYADDVQCAHGSTMGALDEKALFYMRSRGIAEAEARALLLEAFAHKFVEKSGDSLGDNLCKTLFQERISTWLRKAL